MYEGDWQPIPGISALATYGHTPGHQSFLVELPESGPVLLVGDVGDLSENFVKEILPGEASDDTQALTSIRRINQLAAERTAQLFIGHDPTFVHHARLTPAFYT